MASFIMISNPVRNSKRLLAQTAIAGSFALAATTMSAHAEAPNVVTTIKPLHSIASAVMEGVGKPHIIIDGAASPHGFALKPSQAFLLQGADVVFWIGPSLSASLAKPISAMAADATTVELMDVANMDHLPYREGANFDSHDHGDHEDHASHEDHDEHEKHADHEEHDDHDDHDEHADHEDHGDHSEHADHKDHDEHEEHAEEHDEHEHEGAEKEHAHSEHAHDSEHEHEKHADAGHADEHGHDHEGAMDPHIWLNPDNGIAIAAVMAETLAKTDPDNAEIYKKNAAAFAERIETLETKIAETLKPVEGKKFVVFHDAYHHFEHHFDFEASGAITISPETVASASRVAEIQDQIKDLSVTCVFQEPQFDAKLVDVVLEGSDARKGTLDPLGTELDNGADLYPELLSSLSASLNSCLSGQS
ncbi:zinc transport system substrate-binding protein [Labrenzia sp. EL_142]|nr:zinc transport system substrate-binding protein [Labrenzia sp. EL_142]